VYAVVRRYSGPGTAQLFDQLERQRGEVERLLRGVPGFVVYTLIRTDQGGLSVTVCHDKAGTDESSRLAAAWVSENVPTTVSPPDITEGAVTLQLC
jgi:hypothetical protein